MPGEPDSARAAREALRKICSADLQRGQLRDRRQYQALFPGFEAEIAAELEALKAAAEPQPSAGAAGAAAEPGLERIGPYQIVAVLGEGGMGTVYLAEQRLPVQRRVALKVIKLGMDSRQVLARFEAERQALAMMNHDAIARVFDAGTTERGQPFFVMEHVEGIPITAYADRHALTIRARIELFARVCAGVQHAHQKGIIHRDLKPSNVLVARREDRAVPKIIDFGLARATDQQLVGQSLFTEQGQILGTPEYMSPEQAGFDPQGIDTRTDIYSLGVMLYELLAGSLPFPTHELRQAGLLEVQRKIREDQPPRPSTRAWSKELRGDLDWIVLKAMAKEPERRYESATGLAMDLRRYLAHEPVLAGPPSAAYRLRKFVRRYRIQVAAAIAVLLTLVAGVVGTTWFALSAKERSEFAEQKRQEAELARSAAKDAAAAASEAAAKADAERRAALRAQSLYLADLADEQTASGDAMTGVLLALEALPRDLGAPERPYVLRAEQALYRSLLAVRETALVRHAEPIGSAGFIPDGSGILTSDNRYMWLYGVRKDRLTTWLWDLDGSPIAALRGAFLGCAPDGTGIVTLLGDRASIWSSAGALAADLHSVAHIESIGFSADGRLVLAKCGNSNARLWDAAGNEQLLLGGTAAYSWTRGRWREVPSNPGRGLDVEQAALSPDGARIATTLRDGTVRLWDAGGNQLAALGDETSGFKNAVFSPDGGRLITTTGFGAATLWRSTGERIASFRDFAGGVWRPDGRGLLTLAFDGTANLWDADGNLIRTLRHTGAIDNATFSADGRHIATMSQDGSAQIWSARGRKTADLIGHRARVGSVMFGPDSRRIVSASADGTARLWRLDGSEIAVLGGHEGPISAGFSPDGRSVLTAGDTTARLWRIDLREVIDLDEPGAVTHAEFSPDGRSVRTVARRANAQWHIPDALKEAIRRASGGRFPESVRGMLTPRYGVAEWDLAGRAVAGSAGASRGIPYEEYGPGGHNTSIFGLRRHHVDVDASGRRLLTCADDVRLWDAAGTAIADLQGVQAAFSTDGRLVVAAAGKAARIVDEDGRERAVLRGHEGLVAHAEFSRDGRLVVTASVDRTARVWTAAGESIAVLSGHDKPVTYATFSADGRRVLTAAYDGAARLWHEDGRPIAVLQHGSVVRAAFNADASRVVTMGWGNAARVWDGDGRETAVLMHDGPVWFASFSPDGRNLVTASDDGKARLWYEDGGLIATFGGEPRSNAQASFSPDGSRILVVTNGTARLYPFYGTQALIDRGHQIAHRWLTPAERERFHLGVDPIPGILDELFAERILVAAVLRALAERTDLSATQLEQARRQARRRVQPSAAELNRRAWELVDPDAAAADDAARALPLARAAVELEPDAAAYRDTLAWALFAAGQYPEAVAESERALELAAAGEKAIYRGYTDRLRAVVDVTALANTTPAADAEAVGWEPRLMVRVGGDVDAGREWHTRWQLRAENGAYFDDPVLDRIVPGLATELAVPPGLLQPSTRYFWRAALRQAPNRRFGFGAETSFTTDAFDLAAVPADLTPLFNRDVVADPGDPQNEPIDASGWSLVVDGFDGKRTANPTVRGLPVDRRIGVHVLADYRGPNCVQLGPGARTELRIDLPRGRYVALRFLVTGGEGATRMPARLVYAGGASEEVGICCPDWYDDPPDGLDPSVTPVRNRMDRLGSGGLENADDPALFEALVTSSAADELVAVVLRPAAAEFAGERTRFNLLALTAMRLAQPVQNR